MFGAFRLGVDETVDRADHCNDKDRAKGIKTAEASSTVSIDGLF